MTRHWGCDDCFLTTARAAEREGVVLNDDYAPILCSKHQPASDNVSRVLGVVADSLYVTFGDNADQYEDDPRRFGVVFPDGEMVDVLIIDGDPPPPIQVTHIGRRDET